MKNYLLLLVFVASCLSIQASQLEKRALSQKPEDKVFALRSDGNIAKPRLSPQYRRFIARNENGQLGFGGLITITTGPIDREDGIKIVYQHVFGE